MFLSRLKELNWSGGLAVIVLINSAQIMRPVLKLSSGIGVLDSGVIALMGSPEMGLRPGMVAGEVSQPGVIFVIYFCLITSSVQFGLV